MAYVEVYIVPIPMQHLDWYKMEMQELAQCWRDAGASTYMETVGDDIPPGNTTSFPLALQLKDDEVVSLGIATFETKEARNEARAKFNADERVRRIFGAVVDKFDMKRLIVGGFETFLED